jgi:hypothetical protein
MPVFVDPRSGDVYANVPDDEADRARTEFGLVSEEEYAHSQQVEAADQGLLSAGVKGFKRGLGAAQDFARSTGMQPLQPGSEAFGMGGGMLPMGEQAPVEAPPVPAAEETFPEAYDEQARLEREASPIASGIGTGLATAPFAAVAGAGAAALGGPALLGAAVGGVATEAAVEAVAQEYDDAWFEQRPMQLRGVAANTLMFSGADFLFRGALKGIGSALAKPKGAIGGRNVVSEAQGAARELVEPTGGGSVGAARAVDLEDEFDTAIKQMSDRDAAVLARDADDHLHLISQHASEEFTRLNNGLSDNLGSKLKYEDIGRYAQEWDAPTVQRQERWWGGVSDEAANGIAALRGSEYDLGNFGKRAAQTLETFWKRATDTADPGQRMVVIDEFKKQLDKLTKSIDASQLDSVARGELKDAIAPTRETLRKGLENGKLFGGAADLQKALNKPWHGLLEHWGKVQNTLTEATGHVQFDVSGAGRITRESTVDRMMAMLGRDPRSSQEFGRHLAGALDNIQGLIDARQKFGITAKDGLDEMAGDIRNLMQDWNLASTVGVAKNRVAAMKKDPRKWATLALDLGERLPMVGSPIKLARTLGDAFTDLHLQKGTPLGRVWDSAYQRYALNPAFQDPSIIRNYPDWIVDALRQRGGSFTPPSGVTGTPAAMVPEMAPANDAIRGVAQPSAGYQRAKALIEKQRGSEAGKVVIGERAHVAKKLSKDEVAAVDSFATDYRAAGMIEQGVPDEQILSQLPEYTAEGLADLRQRMPALKAAWRKLSVWNPTSDKPLVKGLALSDADIESMVQAGEWTSPNSTYATWDPATARKFAGRGASTGKRPVLLVYDGVPTAVPSVGGVKKYDTLAHADRLGEEMIIPRGIPFKVRLGAVEDGVQTIHLQGPAAGESGFVNFAGGRVGSNFSLGDVAKSPMGVVTGAGAAGLGLAHVARHEPEPPPAQAPEHAYRDALREIGQAGQQQIRTMATEALRKKPPRGKDRDPLALFAGKHARIQDAVEEARERLDEIMGDPMSLAEQLGGSAGDLSKTHPSVYMALTEKAGAVAAYLQGVLPQKTATTLLDPRGGAISFDRAWDFAARFVGATQPRVALREVVRGAAPPEMLEAVQANWPELWDGFRVEMLGQVQRMSEAGRHIPSEKLRRLDSMLGMNGMLDPSASIDVGKHFLAAQDAEAQKRQQAGQGGKPMPTSGGAGSSFRTQLERVNVERQMT